MRLQPFPLTSNYLIFRRFAALPGFLAGLPGVSACFRHNAEVSVGRSITLTRPGRVHQWRRNDDWGGTESYMPQQRAAMRSKWRRTVG